MQVRILPSHKSFLMNRKDRQTLRRQRGTLSICRLLFMASLVATILYLIQLAICR